MIFLQKKKCVFIRCKCLPREFPLRITKTGQRLAAGEPNWDISADGCPSSTLESSTCACFPQTTTTGFPSRLAMDDRD